MTDRISTAIRLPKELHDRLQRESIDRELSINALVTRAVEQYLAGLIPVSDALVTWGPDHPSYDEMGQ